MICASRGPAFDLCGWPNASGGKGKPQPRLKAIVGMVGEQDQVTHLGLPQRQKDAVESLIQEMSEP